MLLPLLTPEADYLLSGLPSREPSPTQIALRRWATGGKGRQGRQRFTLVGHRRFATGGKLLLAQRRFADPLPTMTAILE